MKKIVFWLVIAVIGLLFTIGVMWQQVKYANEKWEVATANIKAYDTQLAAEGEKNIALQLTVDQLGYFKDSVLQELDNTRKELKIKDKNLKALQAVKSGFTRTDTITITQTDTLFKEPSLNIDTLIGDEWYSLELGLKYPNTIAAKTSFKSEKHVVVYTDKETVNPPKKFFLFRWFQKKHIVTLVEVLEKNPYVTSESQRYIEIVK